MPLPHYSPRIDQYSIDESFFEADESMAKVFFREHTEDHPTLFNKITIDELSEKPDSLLYRYGSKISADVEDPDLKAYKGEALVYRGFVHAYLAQMFQQTYIGNEEAPGVPIVLTPDEAEEAFAGRAPLSKVYAQVEKDFKTGMELLAGWKRPNKTMIDEQVAAGLYTRVCLVTNNWDDAITYARKARAGYSVYTPEELLADNAFNNISAKEWMWGADITAETSTAFASFFSFMCSYDAGYGGDVGQYRKIDAKLYDSMNATDVRKKLFKHSSTGV